MKKTRLLYFLIISSLLIFLLQACGDGGTAGDADSPDGLGAGVPTKIVLVPSQYIARTGGVIRLQAKVIDGNGRPIAGLTVSFANRTSVGALSAPSALTDEGGVAVVELTSPATGYAVVEASAPSGLKDRKSVFFNGEAASNRILTLHADGDGSGVFDEPQDFQAFAGGAVSLKAVLVGLSGAPVSGETVAFYTGFPTEAAFFDTLGIPATSVLTDSAGQAMINLRTDSVIGQYANLLNVSAYDPTGAVDMITLWLTNVRVAGIEFTRFPETYTIVEEEETGGTGSSSARETDAATDGVTIEVLVRTSESGVAVPDGTIVKLAFDRQTDGSVDETVYLSTKNGKAQYSFLPETAGLWTITASSGGASVSRTMLVTEGLSIIPDTFEFEFSSDVDVPVSYMVSGGIPPYTVYFDVQDAISAASETQNGDTVGAEQFSVTYACVSGQSWDFFMTVMDSEGSVAKSSVDLKYTAAALPSPSISPSSQSPFPCEDKLLTFTVYGGTPGYTVTSSRADLTDPDIWSLSSSGETFAVDIDVSPIPSGSGASIIFTVVDSNDKSATATVAIAACP